MKRIGTIPSLLVLSVVTLLLFTNSCLPKSKPSTVTTIGGQERNVRELKSLIYELTAQLSGTIETATTAIQLETDDVEIERAALMFKAEAVPALLHASFRHDPIMAVADISLLTVGIAAPLLVVPLMILWQQRELTYDELAALILRMIVHGCCDQNPARTRRHWGVLGT